MDQELTQEVGQQIEAFYEQIKATLLDQSNYSNKPKIDHAITYISFVEATLVQPYSRIVHIYSFFDLATKLMTTRMYPFCYLLLSARKKITRLHQQTEWLMDGLEEFDIQCSEALGIEPHELSDNL